MVRTLQITLLLALITFTNCDIEQPKTADNSMDEPISYLEPVESEKNINTFLFSDKRIKLPVGFRVIESIGPDFVVYYISYPNGVYGGVFFGYYPDLPDRLYKLTTKNHIYEKIRLEPDDPFNLLNPMKELKLNGYYTEEYEELTPDPIIETSKAREIRDTLFDSPYYPYFRDKYLTKEKYRLEARKYDSTYCWLSSPSANKYGKFDALIYEDTRYGVQTHIFGEVNAYSSFNKLNAFTLQFLPKYVP